MTGCGLCGEEGAREIDPQHAVPILQTRIQCQLVQRDAGIVDGNVDAAEAPNRLRHLRIALNRIGNVRRKGVG